MRTARMMLRSVVVAGGLSLALGTLAGGCLEIAEPLDKGRFDDLPRDTGDDVAETGDAISDVAETSDDTVPEVEPDTTPDIAPD